MNKKMKRFLLGSTIILSIMTASVVYYLNDDLDATPNALSYMVSTEVVHVVETSSYVAFEPINETPTTTGIIFFQGGKVDHRAYAPLLHTLATHNILSVGLISPFKLAMFSLNQPNEVIEEYPMISNWIVMGHSLGGVFGSVYAYENETIDGLILLASYVINDFSSSSQKVLSITASEDKVLAMDKYEEGKTLLPSQTTYFIIEGGNHGQFGDYGPQPGDGTPTINKDQQLNLLVDEIMSWLNTNFAS